MPFAMCENIISPSFSFLAPAYFRCSRAGEAAQSRRIIRGTASALNARKHTCREESIPAILSTKFLRILSEGFHRRNVREIDDAQIHTSRVASRDAGSVFVRAGNGSQDGGRFGI
jgi:hypothetical protein